MLYCPNCEQLHPLDAFSEPKTCENCRNKNILVNYDDIYELSEERNYDLINNEKDRLPAGKISILVLILMVGTIVIGISLSFISIIITAICLFSILIYLIGAIVLIWNNKNKHFKDNYIPENRRLESIEGLCSNVTPKNISELPLIESLAKKEGIKTPKKLHGMRFMKLVDYLDGYDKTYPDL